MIGRVLIGAGLALAVLGVLVLILDRSGLPVGRLPGDIRIERPGVKFYAPFATMILLSLVLSIGLWLMGLLKR